MTKKGNEIASEPASLCGQCAELELEGCESHQMAVDQEEREAVHRKMTEVVQHVGFKSTVRICFHRQKPSLTDG